MAAAKKNKQRSITARYLLIACLFVAWMGVIIWRLAYLQIVRHDELAEKAARQRNGTEIIAPARGTIVDRHGTLLAGSVDTLSIKADLHQVEEKNYPAVISALAEKLGLSETDLARLFRSGSKDLTIAKKVTPEVAEQIRSLTENANLKESRKFTGIKIIHEPQRLYPQGKLAAHVLGFVNKPELVVQGAAGLEATQNELLSGQAGKIFYEKDGQGQGLTRSDQAALAGATIITTLDAGLQQKVEAALTQAVDETRSLSGSAIVMEISTGEILALANYPTYDPMARWNGKEDENYARRNRALTDPYEPGSVFKMVTYSAAIEEGIVRPEDKIHCGNGQIALGSRIVHDSHGYGEITVAEALAKSSNVGAIKLGLQLGKERMFAYLSRFGFGRKTGIDLPAESVGIVRPLKDWTYDSMGSIPMGHEISVTAIQAVTAMAAIANRGTWVQPHIVKQLVSSDDSQRELWKAKPETRQVISEQTADTIKDMLAGVVESGTARHAVQLAGYTAAGKTGTAQKVIDKKYSKTAYVASFAGFVPATTPRFAIIVVLDYPKGAHQGGQVAAPVFNQIAQAALGDYGVLPDTEEYRQKIAELQEEFRAQTKAVTKTLTASQTSDKAIETATYHPSAKPTVAPTQAAAKAKPTPKPTPVLKLPTPQAPNKTVVAAKKVTPSSKTSSAKPTTAQVPNVMGRSLREVTSVCSQAGIKLKVIGSGVAKSQRRVGDTLIVEFR
jgi:cell division protein FtsI/penicillin-binding protein 2